MREKGQVTQGSKQMATSKSLGQELVDGVSVAVPAQRSIAVPLPPPSCAVITFC